jgi:cryptochrome
MRQLKQEGWIHHVCRNSVAVFLTRGDLFLSWERGMKTFLRYQIDVIYFQNFFRRLYALTLVNYHRPIGVFVPVIGTGSAVAILKKFLTQLLLSVR